jgi:aldehyde dehydrogenase (NAD+)
MSIASQASAPIRNADRFFIGGQWVAPSSDATIKVIDPGTEELYFSVAEAQAADIARAVGAAREAFDSGPWPRLTHERRAEYLRALAAEVRKTGDDVALRLRHSGDPDRDRHEQQAGQRGGGTA